MSRFTYHLTPRYQGQDRCWSQRLRFWLWHFHSLELAQSEHLSFEHHFLACALLCQQQQL
jgi:hypothetical protein